MLKELTGDMTKSLTKSESIRDVVSDVVSDVVRINKIAFQKDLRKNGASDGFYETSRR
jgi:hypothetical protein